MFVFGDRVTLATPGSVSVLDHTMAVPIITCEQCGRTAADTPFSRNMCDRCRGLITRACTALSQSCRAGRMPDPRWERFHVNGRMHLGQRNYRWLCREHAPRQEINEHPDKCATPDCPFTVESPSQLRKTRNKRHCDICKRVKQVEHTNLFILLKPFLT